MAESKSPKPITTATLVDGSTVAVNDHVYLAPEHLGEPYYIGRIMEFCASSKRRGLQARIAWYNRPKDVISRRSHDPRLLVATMHSDLNPVSSIRGKCTVTHKHYIPAGQLEEYKKQDDHFYYHQLYDRYMQRLYDVVPCELVQNVPEPILKTLRERYQFIVVEQGKAADLTVAMRTCCVCQDWCASASSVRCAACQKNYHMACLNPPLLRKPSKGFAWQCAFCSRKEVLEKPNISIPADPSRSAGSSHETKSEHPSSSSSERVVRRQTRHSSRSKAQKVETTTPAKMEPPSSPAATRQPTELRLKLPSKPADQVNNNHLRTTNMWPFRYFGVHTEIQDILDIDDRIYPRARSRIGNRFQADVPPSTETEQSENAAATEPSSSPRISNSKSRSKRVDKRGKQKQKRKADGSLKIAFFDSTKQEDEPESHERVQRGTDETLTPLFSQPTRLDEAAMTQYMDKVRALPNLPLPPHSGDLLDRALLELEKNDYDPVIALEKMSQLTAADFPDLVEWTPEEVAAFEEGIKTHGHELHQVSKFVPSKRHKDVVRFFYQWKKTDRYETVYSLWTKIYKPSKKFKKFDGSSAAVADDDDDLKASGDDSDSGEESDPTVVRVSAQVKANFHCNNCGTIDSTTWRRLPTDIDRKRKQFRQVLCNTCGEYWLKYSIMRKPPSPSSGANVVAGDKGGSPSSRGTLNGSARGNNRRKRPLEGGSSKSNKRRIKDDKRAMTLQFEPSPCAVCDQMGPQERLYTCHDCGMSVHDDCYGISRSVKEGWICDVCHNKKNPQASYVYECVLCYEPRSTPRQALKMTSSYNWAHVTCATFIPEVKFVNIETMKPVEYIGAIHKARWSETCELCNDKKGACVVCGECKKIVHVQCARKNKFRVAFEIQHYKPTTKQQQSSSCSVTTVPSGMFGTNSAGGLMVPQVWCAHHDLSKLNIVDLHTRTTDTNESCIRAYSKLYKEVDSRTTPAMRRYRAHLVASGYPYITAIYYGQTLELQNAPPPTNTPVSIPSPRKATLLAMKSAVPPPSSPSAITPPANNNNTSTSTAGRSIPIPTCSECPVTCSPYWWPADPQDPSNEKKICQRCYWQRKNAKNIV